MIRRRLFIATGHRLCRHHRLLGHDRSEAARNGRFVLGVLPEKRDYPCGEGVLRVHRPRR